MTSPARRPGARRPLFGGPLHDELTGAPELAVLSALIAVIEVVGPALYAAYPEVGDPDRPYWLHSPAPVPHAARILRDADRLRRAVERYRRAVTSPPPSHAPPPPSDDDTIF